MWESWDHEENLGGDYHATGGLDVVEAAIDLGSRWEQLNELKASINQLAIEQTDDDVDQVWLRACNIGLGDRNFQKWEENSIDSLVFNLCKLICIKDVYILQLYITVTSVRVIVDQPSFFQRIIFLRQCRFLFILRRFVYQKWLDSLTYIRCFKEDLILVCLLFIFFLILLSFFFILFNFLTRNYDGFQLCQRNFWIA